MSTISAILQPDIDGCVHLQLPEELRGGKVKIVASIESLGSSTEVPAGRIVLGEFGRRVLVAPEGSPPMTSAYLKALLREEE